MDTSVIALHLQDGSEIFVEVEQPEGLYGAAAFGDADPGKIDFRSALSRIRGAANELLETIRSLEARPDTWEVSFGIKLNAQAGAIIAKASAEANFTVKLGWSRSSRE